MDVIIIILLTKWVNIIIYTWCYENGVEHYKDYLKVRKENPLWLPMLLKDLEGLVETEIEDSLGIVEWFDSEVIIAVAAYIKVHSSQTLVLETFIRVDFEGFHFEVGVQAEVEAVLALSLCDWKRKFGLVSCNVKNTTVEVKQKNQEH